MADSLQRGLAPLRTALLGDPGEGHVHPGILVLLHVHVAGDGRCQVDPAGVEYFPSVLILAPVEVPVVGGLRLRLATRKAFPHRALLSPRPVIVLGVPGSDLLDSWPHPWPAVDATDLDPRLVAELELAVRQRGLAPGEPDVLRGVDFAPQPVAVGGGREGPRGIVGGSGPDLLLPLLVHPTLQVGAPVVGQDSLDLPLRPGYGRSDPFVAVGGTNLLGYLLLFEISIRGDHMLALTKLPRQGLILAADRGEDVIDLIVAEAEMGLELIDVLLLGEDDGDSWLLGVRVRGILLGLDGDAISGQQHQDRRQREKPERRSPVTPAL